MNLKNRFASPVFGIQLLAAAVLSGYGFIVSAEEAAHMDKQHHNELATSYDSEVNDINARIAQHEKMAKTYDTLYQGLKGGQGRAAVQHCRKMIKSYQAAASSAAELAKLHRALEQEAKP